MIDISVIHTDSKSYSQKPQDCVGQQNIYLLIAKTYFTIISSNDPFICCCFCHRNCCALSAFKIYLIKKILDFCVWLAMDPYVLWDVGHWKPCHPKYCDKQLTFMWWRFEAGPLKIHWYIDEYVQFWLKHVVFAHCFDCLEKITLLCEGFEAIH